jgi:hypothetical protein
MYAIEMCGEPRKVRINHMRIASENTLCAHGWRWVNTVAQQYDFKRQDFHCRGTRLKSLASFAMGFVIAFSLTASGVSQEREEDETYNHPFWDAPSASDESAAWSFVQKAFAAKDISSRERLYRNAIAALFKDGGAGPKAARDEGYRDAMAIAYARFPDDETKLFYGLAILGTTERVPRGLSVKLRRRSSSKKLDASKNLANSLPF